MDPVLRRFTSALGKADTTFPQVVDYPKAWLDANAKQLEKMLQDLPIFSAEESASLINFHTVYPRFLAYTIAYIKLCSSPEKTSSLEYMDIKQLQWSQTDELALLVDHRSVRDTLLGILTQCDHMNASSDTVIPFHLHKLLRLDIICITARTLEILYDPQRKERILCQQGAAAQAQLDLFQALLDLSDFGAQIRSPILTAVSLLTKSSGLRPSCLDLQDLTIPEANPVSGGSFSDVYKGHLGGHTVAVKFMRVFQTSDVSVIIKSFSKEAVLWRQLFHPNVLPFCGVHQSSDTSRPRIGLVSPWMENGTVVEYLRNSPQADRPSLLLDIARGLEYLHNFNPVVVHGDLKGSNIFITPSLGACIADFGLCTLIYDTMIQSSPSSGAFRFGAFSFRAPELLMVEEHQKRPPKTPPCDIYSFGCVCYEIFLGRPRRPVDAIGNQKTPRPSPQICNRVGLDDVIWDLMDRCWQNNAADRPTAIELVQLLSAQLAARGLEVPDARWDETVMQLRAALIEDSRSADIFADINLEEYVDVQRSPTISTGQTPKSSSYFSCDSVLSLQSTVRIVEGKDIVLAAMGPTGTGKSTFINTAMGRESADVGHSLLSGTQGVCAIRCPHPDGSGRNIVFLDTPGFNDSDRSDFDVLADIAAWLKQTYENQITLTGILYFHSISEARMRGTPLRNLSMFQELVGEHALQNVILTTTMWSEVTAEEGLKREEDLQSKFWFQMMERGSRIARFADTQESAWRLIGMFDDVMRRPIKVQRELVDEGKKLERTSAYAVLVRWWDQAVNKVKVVLGSKGKARSATPSPKPRARRSRSVVGSNSSQDAEFERVLISENRLAASNYSQSSICSDDVVDFSGRVSHQSSTKRIFRPGKPQKL